MLLARGGRGAGSGGACRCAASPSSLSSSSSHLLSPLLSPLLPGPRPVARPSPRAVARGATVASAAAGSSTAAAWRRAAASSSPSRRCRASPFAPRRATATGDDGGPEGGRGGSGGESSSSSSSDSGGGGGGGSPEGPSTAEDAYAALGLDPASVRTFEDVVAAKNRVFAAAPAGDAAGDARRREAEAAYDLLFMRDMRRRLSGETEVSASVRYADVAPAPRRGPGSSSKKAGGGGGGGKAGGGGGGGGLGALFGGGGGGGGRSSGGASAVRGIRAGASAGGGRGRAPSRGGVAGLAVRPVQGEQALRLAAGFGAMLLWALAGALAESPERSGDVAALPLALAGVWAVYSLRQGKGLSLARASGITAGGAVAGVLLGSAVNAWLRVDIVPLGAFGSPGVLVTDSAILAIWAACALLE